MPLKPQYGNFFKFDENDLIINRIEAFPKVEFFVHSNAVYFNNENNNASNPNVPNGHLSLYDYNVNRDSNPANGQLIHPFVTKIGAGTSLGTVTTSNYVFDFDVGDKITGSYPMTASISIDRLGTKAMWSTLTESADGKKQYYIPALRNHLNYYTKLSPHYEYSSSQHGDLDDKYVNLISIPSIFYGSEIKKGTVTLKYFVSGTLVGEASDINKNGELIHTTGSEGAVTTGSVVGVVLYNEGFILLKSNDSIANHTERYDGPTDGVEPAVANASWFNFGATGSTAGAPSSSFSIHLSGTSYIDTMTMFAHASENKLNFSNNPTYLTSNVKQVVTGSDHYVEGAGIAIKNVVSSSYAAHSATFEPTTYITKVGIYDQNKNLIAIASLAKPMRKREKDSYTFKLKLDI